MAHVSPSDPLYCTKCSGSGYIPAYAGYAGGVCFQCGGKGRERNQRTHRATQSPKPVLEDWREGLPRKSMKLLGIDWVIYRWKSGTFQVVPKALNNPYFPEGFTAHVANGRVTVEEGTTGTTRDALGIPKNENDEHDTRIWIALVKRLQTELQKRLRV